MGMNYLVIDTSSIVASAALFSGGVYVGGFSSEKQKSHSEILNTKVQELLDLINIEYKDLNFIAVAIGPGSFTGIRVGLAFVKTISFLSGTPIVPLCSMENLIQTYMAQNQVHNAKVLGINNAFKNKVFFLERDLESTFDNKVSDVALLTSGEALYRINPDTVIVGDALDFYPELKKKYSEYRSTNSVLKYANSKYLQNHAIQKFNEGQTKDWKSLLPLYLKASEAEENLKLGLLKVGRHV